MFSQKDNNIFNNVKFATDRPTLIGSNIR